MYYLESIYQSIYFIFIVSCISLGIVAIVIHIRLWFLVMHSFHTFDFFSGDHSNIDIKTYLGFALQTTLPVFNKKEAHYTPFVNILSHNKN